MSDSIVLCYHSLSEDWPATLNVKPDLFKRQVGFLLEHGYRGTTFTDAVESGGQGRQLVVTFDDAFRSVLELALPVLGDFGIPATVFAVSSFATSGEPLAWDGIDHWQGGPHEAELAGMGWDELRGLTEAGWEVGSHTCTHPHLTAIDDVELARELRDSRRACEREIGIACDSIAYPYGDVDPRVVAATRAAGYRSGAALPPRLHRPRPLEWPRIGVWWGDDMRRFRIKVSRSIRRARLLSGR